MLSRLPIPLRLLLLTALASTTTAVPASRLFARKDTCSADQVSCPSILPDDFCCPSGTSCNALAGGTTAICCPEGRSCNKIQPITCNIETQDVSKNPDGPIKTTVFDVDLEKCGNACCPFGYSCSGDAKECVMDSDQSNIPAGHKASTSATAGPTATATSPSDTETASGTASPSSTLPSQATDSEPDSNQNSNSGPATTSIIGGVVGSALVLLVIAIIVFLYIRRKNRRNAINGEKSGHFYNSGRPASSTGSFGNIISDPIVQPGSYRTDFILKTPSSRASTAPRRFSIAPKPQLPRIRISIPNPFDSPNSSPNPPSTALSSPLDDRPPRTGNVAARLPPIRAMKASSHWSRRPGTPELQREPSSESINVFADPNTVESKPKTRRLTHATTFTDLMDEADLTEVRRGYPYVAKNPHVPGTTPKI
ncbi:Fc.00g062640.m01.CDS01 [Cosmosporella sp. VM-42]